jgi:hypothetical protein
MGFSEDPENRLWRNSKGLTLSGARQYTEHAFSFLIEGSRLPLLSRVRSLFASLRGKVLKEAFCDSQKKLIRDILEKGVMEKVFRKMDCHETASALFYCLRGMILAHISGDLEHQSKAGLSGNPGELFLNGLPRDKGP